jgi:hypothetical protein
VEFEESEESEKKDEGGDGGFMVLESVLEVLQQAVKNVPVVAEHAN